MSVQISLCVHLILLFPSLLFSQSNRFVNPSGSDTGNCTGYGSPCQTIDYAITQSSNGDLIYLSDGTFSSATISERVTVKGNGSGSIVSGISVNAATSGTDLVTISDLTVTGTTIGVGISTSYVTLDGVDASGHSSRNVALDASGDITNITLENCTLDNGTSSGLHISEATGVDGLTVLNSTMDGNQFGVYFANGNSAILNRVQNVIIRNCTFSNNTDKGLYIEKLESALFENISVIGSGTNATYAFNNGIDINLKWQSYSDITIRNSRVTGCGAIGPNAIGTAPENRRTSAIAIKARTDAPSYHAPLPLASLSNVTLDGVIIDGLVTDLRFGEMGKTDNDGIDMTTVTITHCSFENDDLAGLLNEENNGVLTIGNNYWGGGAPSGTDIQDYGTSSSTSQSSELSNLIVDESHNTYASFAAALASVAASGTIQNIPSGAEVGTTTISQSVTLATPGAGLLDPTNSLTTFGDLDVSAGTLTLASDFAASTSVTLSGDVVLGDYNVDGAAVTVNSTSSIQDGVDMTISGGTVTVASGTYAETISISDPIVMDGSAGAILEPASPSTVIDIDSDNVTIDGFQIGTDGATSNAIIGINSFRNNGITIQNNTIYANTLGVSSSISESGSLVIDNNTIQMLALEDAISSNGSLGLYLHYAVGTVDADITNNDISNAVNGIFAFGLTSSTEAVIDGGTYTGCTTGVVPINTDGTSFSPSTLTIQNLTMSGFATDTDVSDTETGVYVVTAGGTAIDDITVTIDNLDISGVNNDLSNYSGIVIGDFPTASDGAGISATIQNCNIHDNSNRGIYTRGEDAVTIISQSSITGNGFDPTATGGNPGFSVIAREGSSTTVSNCFISNPSTLSAAENIPGNYYVSGLHISTSGAILVTDCNLSNNGNGFITETSGIDLSGNYFGTTDEATILSLTGGSNDFTPWLSSGADTDGATSGFQGDFSSLMVGPTGAQTTGSRIQEGHDLVSALGVVAVNQADYSETLTVAKSFSLSPESNTSLDNLVMNGTLETLTLSTDLIINTGITFTDGIINANAGTILLGTSASDVSESSTSYVDGNITMQPRALGTGAIDFLGLTIAAGADDLGNLTLIRGAGSGAVMTDGFNTGIAINWDISTDNPPTSGRDITFTWLPTFDNGKDMTQASVFRNPGSGWVEVGLPEDISATDPRTISRTGVTAFSIWTIAQDDQPLPVELVDFEGEMVNDGALLSWATLTEKNSAYFEIQRSLADEFNSIAFVSSNGNSKERNEYTYLDKEVQYGTVALYRLKMVDLDGTFEYSKSIAIAPKSIVQKFEIYPNPSSDKINMTGIPSLLIKELSIYDLEGRLMKNTQEKNSIQISDLPSGYYFLVLRTIQNQILAQRFIRR